MRNLTVLVAVFVLFFSFLDGLSTAKTRVSSKKTTHTKKATQKEAYEMPTVQERESQKQPLVKPNPLRGVCAYMWDRYYEMERVDIDVSTKGAYNETVVFTCPDCSIEEHFVNPFLDTEYRGKTGMDRIKECGYTRVVFRGGRGLQEIVRQVPD
jgi:hypothetical protein